MCNTKSILFIFVMVSFSQMLIINQASAIVPIAKPITKQILKSTLEDAAKVSEKTLTPAAEKMFGEQLVRYSTKYGDDVYNAVSKGGFEVLELGSKYGDDAIRICTKAPNAARSFVLMPDVYLPLAKQYGSAFLHVADRAGAEIAERAAKKGGTEMLTTLLKVPAKNIPKAVGIAEHTKNPITRWCFRKAISKNPSIIDCISGAAILKTGGLKLVTLSAAAGGGFALAKAVIAESKGALQVLLYGVATVLVLIFAGKNAKTIRKLFVRDKTPKPATVVTDIVNQASEKTEKNT